MCEKEIGAFNKCYTGFKANASKAKAFRESGVLPLGQYAKMSGEKSLPGIIHHPDSHHDIMIVIMIVLPIVLLASTLPPGPQMNEYMSSFAYGGRKRRSQYHANSVFKEGAR